MHVCSNAVVAFYICCFVDTESPKPIGKDRKVPYYLVQYTQTYAWFCFFCVFIMITMIVHMNRNMGSELEVHNFRLAALSGSLCMLSQAIWMLGCGHIVPCPPIVNALVNFCDLTFTGMTVYYWFRFIECKSSQRVFDRNRLMHLLTYVPLWTLILVNFLSLFTGWTFFINEQNEYVRGPLYAVQVIGSYSYYVMSLVVSLMGMAKGSLTERILSRQLLVFSMFPIVGGILQVIFGRLPFSISTVLISIYYLFINMQNQRINTDALTGLNNRLRTKQFLETKIREADTKPFYLFMIDVNRFKEINDQYGHICGDQALMVISDTLRGMGAIHRGFTGRYGGDEFTIIIDADNIQNPSGFSTQLNKLLGEMLESRNVEFPVTVAIGYTSCCNNGESFTEVVDRADQMLYREKERLQREGIR